MKDLAVMISERKGMTLSKIPRDEDCPEPLLVIAGKGTGGSNASTIHGLITLPKLSKLHSSSRSREDPFCRPVGCSSALDTIA